MALTRAIQHTYIVSPVDMAGLIGMAAQTLAVFHFVYHTLKRREIQFHGTTRISTDAAAGDLTLASHRKTGRHWQLQ